MDIWLILTIIGTSSVILAIVISKIAKWSGKYETISTYLLLFGLLFTPTSLVIGAFDGEWKIQLTAIGVFLILITLCFVRLYRADHPKAEKSVAASNYCPYCGKVLQTDMRFCPSCGRKITKHGGH